MTEKQLADFVTESFRIEGIYLPQAELDKQVETLSYVLARTEPWTVKSVAALAISIAGEHAELRSRKGLDVVIGDHLPMRGGRPVVDRLRSLLGQLSYLHPYATHQKFECLHPFMDGNGRTGRALWLWQMQNTRRISQPAALGFLHCWYYQSLAANRDVE